MNIIKTHNLACPIDGKRLETQEKQLVCENGHTFDVARQGYVNLLPVQHKRSKNPGDSKEMVVARTEFLNSGIYQPIARQLAEITFLNIANSKQACLLDAGCGEGYYTDTVLSVLMLSDNNCNLSIVGLDISKEAIVEASKRNKQISWVVGTNRQPPVVEASIDIVLCIFGFQNFEGFNNCLKPGGKIILVEPGPDHLKELREIIYPDVKKSDPQDLSNLKTIGLSLVDSQQLQFKASIDNNQQISNLLVMTPHLYRASKEGRDKAEELQQLDITVDVVFRTLQKESLQ